MDEDLLTPIEELALLYSLEDSILDIYVEGETDKAFLEHFVKYHNLNNVTITEICKVAISDITTNRNNNGGNKGKLISLATQLHDLISDKKNNVFCIVDTDLDRVMGITYTSYCLRLTDYTCIEMYTFTRECLDHFFDLIFRRELPVDFIESLFNVLKKLFKIRIQKKLLANDITWISFSRCCALNDDLINFDINDYIERLLGSQGKRHLIETFTDAVQDFNPILDEYRHYTYDDDYIEALSWYGKEIGIKSKYYDIDVIKRTLFTCVNYETICEYPLLKEIKDTSINNISVST